MCPDNLTQPQIHKLVRAYKYDDGALVMNCFCGGFDRRIEFSFISKQDHCQSSSPSRISDTLRVGIEPAQKLSLGLVE